MTAHLLLVTVGPVQELIAQARRTRDLWYGSHLLSELSRRVAREVARRGGALVFPALDASDGELDPCMAPLRPSGEPPMNVANKILAEIPDGLAPSTIARAARDELRRFWRDDVARGVQVRTSGLLAKGVDAAWAEQIDTALEFAAGWAPLGDYAEARREVERAVAARKTLRDFGPWKHIRGHVPKSSLDGARETVLAPARQRDRGLVRAYRIAEGEQLDAVGIVKRAGGDPGQFVPIANVALAGWLREAWRVAPTALQKLQAACADLKLARVVRSDLPVARAFPFDASVLLPDRWPSVFEEQVSGSPADARAWGEQHVHPLLRAMSAPSPYVACLVADGDGMGRAIGAHDTAEGHRALSRHLADFATQARAIVEQDHLGSLVYAGGDDVLAFVTLPHALRCADALRRAFEARMAQSAPGTTDRPTLSVGLGIGHIMDGMGDLLELGRAAEHEAKGAAYQALGLDRNALAVIVDKRSGGRLTWRARWSEWDGDPAGRILADVGALGGDLSTRKVYEIATTLRRLPKPPADDGWAEVLGMEVRRSLRRTHAGDRDVDAASVGLVLDDRAPYATLHRTVSAWVERMRIARALAEATPRARAAIEETVA